MLTVFEFQRVIFCDSHYLMVEPSATLNLYLVRYDLIGSFLPHNNIQLNNIQVTIQLTFVSAVVSFRLHRNTFFVS